MPNLNARTGQRYSVEATEGLADFERQQLRTRAATNQLKKVMALQNNQGEPRNREERLVIKRETFKLQYIVIVIIYVFFRDYHLLFIVEE